jgi:hypothetical protein
MSLVASAVGDGPRAFKCRQRVVPVPMPSRPTRRDCLGSLSIAALGALAGCTESLSGSGDGDDPATTTQDATTTSPPTDETTTTEETTTEADDDGGGDEPPAAESPEAAFRQYLETAAEDPGSVPAYFHPIHPFGPEKLSAEDAEELFGQASHPEVTALEVERRELSGAAVLERSFLRSTDLAAEDVAAAVDGEETAVLEAEVAQGDGQSEDSRLVLVTHDGGWVILAQAFQPAGDPNEDSPFEAQVVDDVAFDTEADTARVEFVPSPVADEITVTAEEAFSERSTDDPAAFEYVTLQVEPDGDTVVVTATVDDETREVHREQYPPSAGPVAEVTFDDDPESDAREAAARVSFTDDWAGDELRVEATVSGFEATVESGTVPNYVLGGIDPDGDEIVVTVTRDGESAVVHRERYHP